MIRRTICRANMAIFEDIRTTPNPRGTVLINSTEEQIIQPCKVNFLGRLKTILKRRNALPMHDRRISKKERNKERNKTLYFRSREQREKDRGKNMWNFHSPFL